MAHAPPPVVRQRSVQETADLLERSLSMNVDCADSASHGIGPWKHFLKEYKGTLKGILGMAQIVLLLFFGGLSLWGLEHD
jgi:hypothetical protein